MNKFDVVAIGTIIKFALGLLGVVLTLILLIMGLLKNDQEKLKKAGMIFLGTCVVLIVLGAIEFLILK